MFDRAPLIAAAAMFTSLRSDIISAENIAITLLSERAKIETLYKKNEDGTFEPAY
jgi:hypothetical protein